ncbi:hypothetical protein JCM10213_005267 [Rhodosporidiobolus nylandii]
MHRRTLREVSPDWLLTLLAIGTVLGDFAILYPREHPSFVSHALGFLATNLVAVELLVQVYWTETRSVIAICVAGFYVTFFGSIFRGTAISANEDLETQRAWFWGFLVIGLFVVGAFGLTNGCDARPAASTDDEAAVGLEPSATATGDAQGSADELQRSAYGAEAVASLLDRLRAKSGSGAPPGYEAVMTSEQNS